MFFGQKLKEIRLKHFNMGIHKFKDTIGTTLSVSELSDIEHGYAPPPSCGRFYAQLSVALNAAPLNMDNNEDRNKSKDFNELISLRWEPFVMQKMPENVFPSPLTCKSDGSPSTTEELEALYHHINSIAKKHNKKAEEFNNSIIEK